MAANREPLAGKRLDSWKEIAAFLERAERTVKRWETERGLPVHRVPGGGRSAVFAYSNELADWLQGQGDTTADVEPVPLPNSEQTKYLIPAHLLACLIPLALAACIIAFLWIGRSAARFKAMAGRHAPNEEAQDLY